MRKRIGYLALGVILLFAGLARAEDISMPAQKKLSLNACIRIALAGQSDILVGQNSVISAKARETQAKSNYFPQVSAQRSGTHTETNALGPGTSSSNESGSVSVSQNIYDGGLREAKVSGAKAATTQSEFTLIRTQQTTVFNVTKDFYSLLQAQSLEVVQEQQVKYLQEQVDLVNAQVKLGAAAEVDALPIESQLATAQYNLLSAKNNVETAAVQLQSAMGLAPQPDFAILESDLPDAGKEIQAMDYYAKEALAARPEVKQAEAAVAGAGSTVKSAHIALLPQPSITADYGKSLMQGNDYAFTLNGGFVFDVFDGGNNRAVYKSARAGLSTAEINAAQTQKDIQSEVKTAYLNLSSSKERMAAADIGLKAAQKNYDVQEARFKQGLAIPLDLLNAQVQLVTAQSNQAQSRYDYYTSLAQLEYATGAWGGIK